MSGYFSVCPASRKPGNIHQYARFFAPCQPKKSRALATKAIIRGTLNSNKTGFFRINSRQLLFLTSFANATNFNGSLAISCIVHQVEQAEKNERISPANYRLRRYQYYRAD